MEVGGKNKWKRSREIDECASFWLNLTGFSAWEANVWKISIEINEIGVPALTSCESLRRNSTQRLTDSRQNACTSSLTVWIKRGDDVDISGIN